MMNWQPNLERSSSQITHSPLRAWQCGLCRRLGHSNPGTAGIAGTVGTGVLQFFLDLIVLHQMISPATALLLADAQKMHTACSFQTNHQA